MNATEKIARLQALDLLEHLIYEYGDTDEWEEEEAQVLGTCPQEGGYWKGKEYV